MCRSIVTLRRADAPATEDEIRAAALQFVRKVSGYRTPSRRNSEAFEGAIDEVAEATRRLLKAVGSPDAAATHATAHAHPHPTGGRHAAAAGGGPATARP
jgi:hypothetical protein